MLLGAESNTLTLGTIWKALSKGLMPIISLGGGQFAGPHYAGGVSCLTRAFLTTTYSCGFLYCNPPRCIMWQTYASIATQSNPKISKRRYTCSLHR